jgi:hypothetical protein
MKEINKIFSELISKRNWYAGTSIKKSRAFGIKDRFEKGELSFGRMCEVLKECGYSICVEK